MSSLDLKVVFLDEVHFRKEHVAVTAVGVDVTGAEHVLVLWEGATENAATSTALLENLTERGLLTDRSMLVVLDGSKALAKAVRAVFGKRALIQRCQVHHADLRIMPKFSPPRPHRRWRSLGWSQHSQSA